MKWSSLRYSFDGGGSIDGRKSIRLKRLSEASASRCADGAGPTGCGRGASKLAPRFARACALALANNGCSHDGRSSSIKKKPRHAVRDSFPRTTSPRQFLSVAGVFLSDQRLRPPHFVQRKVTRVAPVRCQRIFAAGASNEARTPRDRCPIELERISRLGSYRRVSRAHGARARPVRPFASCCVTVRPHPSLASPPGDALNDLKPARPREQERSNSTSFFASRAPRRFDQSYWDKITYLIEVYEAPPCGHLRDGKWEDHAREFVSKTV